MDRGTKMKNFQKTVAIVIIAGIVLMVAFAIGYRIGYVFMKEAIQQTGVIK